MERNAEFKYLICILPLIVIAFFTAYSGFDDRAVSTTLETLKSPVDISAYFLSAYPNALYGPMFCAIFLSLHILMRKKLPGADPFILPAVALLCGIGAVMMYRLSPDLAATRSHAINSFLRHNPDAHMTDNVLLLVQLGSKHFIHVIVGVIAMIASFYIFNKRLLSWLSSKKYLWVLVSILLISATLSFGTRIHGKSLWLWGFQTVELVKLLMLLFISGYVYEKGRGMEAYSGLTITRWFTYAGPFILMWFFALLPLFIQRDLGPTFLMFIVFLLMFHFAGNRYSVTLMFIVLTAASGYITYTFEYPSIVKERFDIMFDPFSSSESMARALWSISSGGLFGSGIGYGQPYRIPVVQSDHNFSAICEEMGLVGGIVVILGYAILVYRCIRISAYTDNIYKKTLVMGIGSLIGIQAFIIISGNLGIVPLTGITLPLISYGGSSMVMTFIMIGIVLKISGEMTCHRSQLKRRG